MQLDHIALYVLDLEAMRSFYETYFGAESNQKYHNTTTGLQTYFLHFADGARLEIMARPGVEERKDKAWWYKGYTHIAFKLDSKQAVDALTARLAADGHPTISGPRTTGDGYYESSVQDPEGNLIELVG